jgi:hypothetical protein
MFHPAAIKVVDKHTGLELVAADALYHGAIMNLADRLIKTEAVLSEFAYGGVLVTVAAARLHIGCADMSLRRNPAILELSNYFF